MFPKHLHGSFSFRSVASLVVLLLPLLVGSASWAQSAPCALSKTNPSMKICLDNVSVYSVKTNTLNAPITASVGTHHLTVQAWDSSGQVFKQSETITVSSSLTAPTASIGASPATIIQGQSATLSWSSTGATSAQINNGPG